MGTFCTIPKERIAAEKEEKLPKSAREVKTAALVDETDGAPLRVPEKSGHMLAKRHKLTGDWEAFCSA